MNPVNTDALLLGYAVEVSDRYQESFTRHVPAYYLHGKRGAFYALYRHRYRLDFLFIVNVSPAYFGSVVTIEGNSWVKEDRENNCLTVVS